jgi:hypothetical protein
MLKRIFLFAVFFILLLPWLPAPAAQEQDNLRPANFIFLIDVSGSMLYKSEMVPGRDGKPIFLFEALRQALQQIVSDEQLVGAKSKMAFITFGTAVTEKADWPSSAATSADRQSLSDKIASVSELQADKHGDTYMAGALDAALRKADQFAEKSEPCTTTFIVMLTDGWDEPPHGAAFNVRDLARQVVNKQKQLKDRLGVNTLQVRVVGLQHLPDRKAGTTTAKELAAMLGGDFMDVSQQSSGTVAERIFAALKKTILELKGKVEIAKADSGGVANFGTIESGNNAQATVRVISRSCYGEQITGVDAEAGALSKADLDKLPADLQGDVTSAPAGSLKFSLANGVLNLTPTLDQVSAGKAGWQQLKIAAHVDNRCPPGVYAGALRLQSSARVENAIPYGIVVPSRIVADKESIQLKVKKPGFLFTEKTSAVLKFTVSEKVSGGNRGKEELNVVVEPATAKSGASLDRSMINNGQPVKIVLDTQSAGGQPVEVTVSVPPDLKPELYAGKIKISLANPGTNAIAPADVPYEIDLLPSPWEQVSPIAVPIFILLFVTLIAWAGFAIAGLRRS